jgi:hypothetical protein
MSKHQHGEKCSPEPWPNYDAQSLDIIIEKLIDRGYTWEGDLWKALVTQIMGQVVDPLQMEVQDLREKFEWIPVDEHLPEEGGRYLCYVEELTDLGFSYYQWNFYFDPMTKTFSSDGDRVTHWMELPEPPQKSKP